MTEVSPISTLNSKNSKSQNNLSPLQLHHKSINTHPAEKTPRKCAPKAKPTNLPKLDLQKSIIQENDKHASHQHSSSPPLAPLNAPSKDKLVTTAFSGHSNHIHSHQKVPPLDQFTAHLPSLCPAPLEYAPRVYVEGERDKASCGTHVSLEPLQVVEYNPSDHNGTVTVIYEMYREKFEIKDGSITASLIDDTYCLSAVMPNCCLSISELSPSELRERVVTAADESSSVQCGTVQLYVPEQPDGTFCTLQNDRSYYLYVQQDEEQVAGERAVAAEDRARRKLRMDEAENSRVRLDDGRGFDSCTCIYGTPCQVRELRVGENACCLCTSLITCLLCSAG